MFLSTFDSIFSWHVPPSWTFLPCNKSYQENTAENLLDLILHLCIYRSLIILTFVHPFHQGQTLSGQFPRGDRIYGQLDDKHCTGSDYSAMRTPNFDLMLWTNTLYSKATFSFGGNSFTLDAMKTPSWRSSLNWQTGHIIPSRLPLCVFMTAIHDYGSPWMQDARP